MKKIALIGANGMLATAIKKSLSAEYQLFSYDLPDFDMTDRTQVLSLQESSPDIIINCAAYTNVDGCEEHRELAMQVNGEALGFLAELAEKTAATLVHISTDFIFDGTKESPYTEDDQPNPLSIYGKSKLAGEKSILGSKLDKYFILRTSWLYGAGGNNFVETIIRLAKEKTELKIVADQRGTPTYTADLAGAIFTLLDLIPHSSPRTPNSPYGIYHFSNDGECSWFEFAQEIIAQYRKKGDLKVEKILPIPTEGYPLPAERPKYSVMSKEKYIKNTGEHVPDWRNSLDRYFKNRS